MKISFHTNVMYRYKFMKILFPTNVMYRDQFMKILLHICTEINLKSYVCSPTHVSLVQDDVFSDSSLMCMNFVCKLVE